MITHIFLFNDNIYKQCYSFKFIGCHEMFNSTMSYWHIFKLSYHEGQIKAAVEVKLTAVISIRNLTP